MFRWHLPCFSVIILSSIFSSHKFMLHVFGLTRKYLKVRYFCSPGKNIETFLLWQIDVSMNSVMCFRNRDRQQRLCPTQKNLLTVFVMIFLLSPPPMLLQNSITFLDENFESERGSWRKVQKIIRYITNLRKLHSWSIWNSCNEYLFVECPNCIKNKIDND